MADTSDLFRPDERVIASIGVGYVLNVLTLGKFQRMGAALTDKRVYFQGRMYERIGRHFIKVRRSKVVCVDDVTGTGFVYVRRIGLLVASVITLLLGLVYASIARPVEVLCFLPTVILFVLYLVTRITLFEINFAGGGMAFRLGLIGVKEAEDFQRNLHLVKDHYKSASREELGESIASATSRAGTAEPKQSGAVCKNCGAPLIPPAVFCGHCGERI
ncbi:MAG: zinc ribbon domain-containing protein [Oscillospiraceae bacterium]|jgi:hypothetical protein|nr:zinc ribbon domain-containing protein [Oscillospiraceae bacterium]